MTLEAQSVKLADRIAYVNHDLEDATQARLLSEDDVPESIFQTLGYSRSARIGTAVTEIIAMSSDRQELCIGPSVLKALNDLKEFLFERVYSLRRSSQSQQVNTVVEGLFGYCCDGGAPPAGGAHSHDESEEIGGPGPSADLRARCRFACDYVAGMTDRFAIQQFTRLFVPYSGDWIE